MGYEADLANRAIDLLTKTASDSSRTLYEVNKDVYSMIRYGVPVRKMEAANCLPKHVFLYDSKNPLNNHFAVAEEVTVKWYRCKKTRYRFIYQRDRVRYN
jgi:type I restriction enzyme R subunit